jgi:dipeptide/tripeptide permease
MKQTLKIFKTYPRTFWIANTVELFERWAWYGFFMVFSLYLVNSTDTGALGFSQAEKGWIMGTGTALLYFLPIITGAIADKIGYKRVLLISFLIYATAFLLLRVFHNFYPVFFVYLFLALGAAFFKPVISATVSKTTNESNASIGFGLFYMMVNIGAFIGPLFSAKLREIGWDYVFFMSAFIIFLNFLLVAFFYKEPERNISSESLGKTIVGILRNIGTVAKDYKFVIFLILISGFWTMYNQLFYTLPTFIEQWGNTKILYDAIANISPAIAQKIGTSNGTIAPEMITNVDAFYIILFQIVVSSFAMRFKPLHAMISGILVSSLGMGLALITQNGLFVIIALLIFGLGEMACSPKVTEYVGRIAPRNKVALYMGCNFLPYAIGNFFAGIISGEVYQKVSDKLTFIHKEALERGLSIPEISATFTQNDYYAKFGELTGLNTDAVTDLLWNKYHPSNIWIIVSGIGVLSGVGLVIYDRLVNTTYTKAIDN